MLDLTKKNWIVSRIQGFIASDIQFSISSDERFDHAPLTEGSRTGTKVSLHVLLNILASVV